MGAAVFSRIDFILRMRIGRKPAIIGIALLGTLLVSLFLFFLLGNGLVSRVLYFPSRSGRHGLLAELRFLPRQRALEKDIAELAEGVLLGPTRYDALKLFPRGGAVLAAMVNGRTLYLDLSSSILLADPEVPLTGQDAFDALGRAVRFNFPRIHEVVFFVDGQQPRFTDKKKI